MIAKEFPEVRLIANKDNKLFAIANNQGAEIAKGKYLLLLNSDTIVEKEIQPHGEMVQRLCGGEFAGVLLEFQSSLFGQPSDIRRPTASERPWPAADNDRTHRTVAPHKIKFSNY